MLNLKPRAKDTRNNAVKTLFLVSDIINLLFKDTA